MKSGLITKCDCIITALTFFKKEVVPTTDATKRSEVDATVDRADGWRKTYRRSNKALQAHSLAKRLEADEGRTKEMESVLQCDNLWKDFLDTCDDVKAEEEVDQTLMTGAIGARLLFDSVQRPGAVIGVTLEEYQRVSGVWVVRVLEHKTSAQGPAHLTLTADTKRYVDRI